MAAELRTPYCMCQGSGSCFFCYLYPYVYKLTSTHAPHWLTLYTLFLQGRSEYPRSGSFSDGRAVRAVTRLVEERVKEMFGNWGLYLLQEGIPKVAAAREQPTTLLRKLKPSRKLMLEELDRESSNSSVVVNHSGR